MEGVQQFQEELFTVIITNTLLPGEDDLSVSGLVGNKRQVHTDEDAHGLPQLYTHIKIMHTCAYTTYTDG